MPRGPRASTEATTDAMGLQKGNLTHLQRLAIIRKKDEEPRWTQEDLARWAKKQFGLLRQPTQATISNTLRARERLETMTTSLGAKSVRPVKHPDLDAALMLWIRWKQCQQPTGTTIAGDQVREKAQHLAKVFELMDTMAYSSGWLRSFLSRHGIVLQRNQIFARETCDASTMYTVMTAYAPQDVFTLVCTNLWYRIAPTKCAPGQRMVGSDDEASMGVGLAVNLDVSERLAPIMIGKQKQPPSFRDKSAFQWSFSEYYHNGLAQMTSSIFEVWVRRLNQRMVQANRRILLVLDSAPSHLNVQFSHVQVLIHRDSEHSSLQGLTTGIASAFKAYYRMRQLAEAMDRDDAGLSNKFEITQLKAMRWIEQAWTEVPASMIEDAWQRSGLTGAPSALPPLVDGKTPAEMAAQEVHRTITGFLEQLDVPGRVKSNDVAYPRGEDEMPHYVYDDSSIIQLLREPQDTKSPLDGNDDIASDQASQPPQVTEESILRKLEHFRAVIETLDEQVPTTEELVTVLTFLRRQQRTMRAELQRLRRESNLVV
ncbi:hypothetical protein Poli38472_006731 [Pythium oligandrum]|uniref:HTH CENPB-type domain-containing protein n=1 Tax=Pythium oligandrum TaxID=41045 RepID=A0A8K1C544_PYTOL|nr:hypothetical protein Poli38472_006731 [Pythium oligandrum]|eukprot:TMW56721.1 hypothetical protein Poli38472_006731 [Pythium oligandrum]